VGIDNINEPVKVDAKVRYRHTASPAVVEPAEEKGSVLVSFENRSGQ